MVALRNVRFSLHKGFEKTLAGGLFFVFTYKALTFIK